MADIDNLSDEELIGLVKKRFKERTQKVSELEFMFDKMEDMNKKLMESEQNKSKFLSLIRNEFNNPLFGILTLIKNMVYKKTSSIEDDSNLNIIYLDILKLNFQLNNIMAAAEIENDVLERNIINFDILSLIDDIKESFGHLYKDKNLLFKLDIEDELHSINHDREKIFFILNNIVDNAYKFSKPNEEIKLKIFLDNNKLIIQLSNKGTLINKKTILESFHESNNEFLSEKRGLGLGLTIVKAYCDFFLGQINFAIDDEKNNVITVLLPFFADNNTDIFGSELDDFDFGFDDDDDDTEGNIF